MMKYLEWEILASESEQARLCTMYKISNDIIHVKKSKYLTQQQQLGLVDLMVLNILLNIQVTMYLRWPEPIYLPVCYIFESRFSAEMI